MSFRRSLQLDAESRNILFLSLKKSQKCNDKAARIADRTKYSVWPEGGTKISVERHDDFVNGKFNDLYKYGKIPTDEDRLITNVKKA